MPAETQALLLLRGDLQNILAGSFSLFIAFLALLIAAVRFKKSSRLLICVGRWSGMYGFNHVFRFETVIQALPPSSEGPSQFPGPLLQLALHRRRRRLRFPRTDAGNVASLPPASSGRRCRRGRRRDYRSSHPSLGKYVCLLE